MKYLLFKYFLFAFFFFTFFSSGFVDSQDGFQYLAVARRFYYDKTFALPVEQFPEKNVHMTADIGNEGKRYSPTGLGYTLALLPAVFAEDIFLRISDSKQISAFPLQSDWPVLLFASFTNAIFGAFLTVVLYLYIRSYRINHKTALLLSFLSLIATNLFPYTKHVFPHMIFISYLVASFYFLRLYSFKKDWKFLIFSGICYGFVIISYNPTFILPAFPYVLYYLLLTKIQLKLDKVTIRRIAKDVFLVIVGVLPFILLYSWFNWVRFGNSTSTGYGEINSNLFYHMLFPPAHNIFEGLWGVLLSPGRSFFLYSPILLLIIVYWFKIKKKFLPEIICFSLLFIIYIYFTATLLGGEDFPVWHGESSWGPRYLTPIIPFGMIIVANIYTQLAKRAKQFIFFPLIAAGIYVQFLGILFPYQIKFAGLQLDAFFNDRNFNMYEYGNEIPRYSPVFKMSKTLVKRFNNLDQQFNHGNYNLRLADGFNLPFDLGPTVWREIMPQARISFINLENQPIKDLDLKIGNHLMTTEKPYDARVKVSLNNSEPEIIRIQAGTSKDISLPLDNLTNNNILDITSSFIGTDSARLKKKQVIFLQELSINKEKQNLQTIDYPYISNVSGKIIGTDYGYWGNTEKDPWEIWYMHSGVYEQTFDLWWLRPFHYWDLPKNIFYPLFIFNILGLLYFGRLCLKAEIK